MDFEQAKAKFLEDYQSMDEVSHILLSNTDEDVDNNILEDDLFHAIRTHVHQNIRDVYGNVLMSDILNKGGHLAILFHDIDTDEREMILIKNEKDDRK